MFTFLLNRQPLKDGLHRVFIRGAKGSPGQSQGKHRMRDYRDFRVKFAPGSWVRERVVLATQGKLDYHPGLNVSRLYERIVCHYSYCLGCH